jgi:hypothetical protein
MNRITALLASVVSLSAGAAEVTRVASSFVDDTPFQMYVDVDFARTQQNATLVRQWHSGGNLVELPELRYQNTDTRLNIDAHIGLYRDLEFHYGVPYIFGQDETWKLSSSNTAASSTILNNCLNADGTLTNPSCPSTGIGASSIFAVPNKSSRSGLGNMTFGLAWAPFSQKRDDTKPTWLIGLDWQAPTATAIDPHLRTSSSNKGDVGDGEHWFTFRTALSRKYDALEPYFKAQVSFTNQAGGFYSNCSNLSSANSAQPNNCGQGPWMRSETGIHQPTIGGVEFGTEIMASETPYGERFGFDFGAIGNFVGPGRYYNELSYELGKLLYSDDYLQVGAKVGVIAQPSKWFYLKAYGTLLYDTEHSITDEATGRDLSGAGAVRLTPGSPDINPNFDSRVDAPNRQFRAADSFTFRLDVSASILF